MTNLLKVFVYGTLKPGGFYYPHYCEGKILAATPAIAYGQLYDLPLGYPAMTRGDRPVRGYLLTLTDATVLEHLDQLEDYKPQRQAEENEYIRQPIETFSPDGIPSGLAWVYVMSVERVLRLGGKLLPDGEWIDRRTNFL